MNTIAPGFIAGTGMNGQLSDEIIKNIAAQLPARRAGQAEDIAAAEERNRLAHELRDSVNQQLFGITLAASSARRLIHRDPARVPVQLDQLQEMTANALGQMRALIAQLRPKEG